MALATPGPGSEPSGQYGYSYMQAAVLACQAANRASTSPCEELQMYLEAPLVDVEAQPSSDASGSPLLTHYIATLNAVSDACTRCKGLSRHPGFFSPLQTRVLQQWLDT
jgi:hypothetical protein